PAMPTLPATRQECSIAANEPIPLDRESLVKAFESFSHVAGSLETSYLKLQGELAMLRHALEIKNQDLARSLAENKRIKTYLAGLLEDLPCGVLAVDGRFKLRFGNPLARKLLIAPPGGSSRPHASIPDTLCSILKEIASEAPGAERTWAFETQEGKKFFAVTCAIRSQASDAEGETVFILRDATEQKRLEEEREFARRMRALAEITALLAHEIRNPLGSLELFAGLIKDATKDQTEVSQWVVHMQAGLRALSATVNNVLHFHSMGPSQFAPLNAVQLLADTIEFLQPLALQRGMGIEFSPEHAEVLVPANTHRLQQVFFNLAINSFRAMPAGKRLKIRVGVEQGEQIDQAGGRRQARIDFEDEGVGIAPEHLEKIFDAGFTTVKSSPGLGLAVCKRVAAQHRGTLKVKSNLGKGTTFSLYLPLLGANS
ncbi:MAG: two-component system sensor histidine kinase NtrB, partial [Terriglobia bacterium]